MAQSSSNKKVANSLVAASAAAVLAVYTAGYARTRSAADQFDAQSAERRPAAPDGRGPAPSAEARTNTPAGRSDSQAPAEPVYDWAHDQGNAPAPVPPAPSAQPGPATANAPAIAPMASSPAAPVASQAKSEPAAAPAAGHKADTAVATPVGSAPAAPTIANAAPAPIVMASAAPAITPPTPAAPVAASVAPASPASAASANSAPSPVAPAAPKWKDGTYTGWGTSRHGDIQAEVIIENGRIMSANIAQCLTRYSCNVIGRLPPEVPQRQSAEVDYVSGATQSTNAYYYAVTEALGKAK
jgi:uncharacterized protein with FMN-binding domain